MWKSSNTANLTHWNKDYGRRNTRKNHCAGNKDFLYGRFVNQLQAVVLEHTKTIDLLRTENKLLAQKVKDMSELMEGDVPNRKPPHY